MITIITGKSGSGKTSKASEIAENGKLKKVSGLIFFTGNMDPERLAAKKGIEFLIIEEVIDQEIEFFFNSFSKNEFDDFIEKIKAKKIPQIIMCCQKYPLKEIIHPCVKVIDMDRENFNKSKN